MSERFELFGRGLRVRSVNYREVVMANGDDSEVIHLRPPCREAAAQIAYARWRALTDGGETRTLGGAEIDGYRASEMAAKEGNAFAERARNNITAEVEAEIASAVAFGKGRA